MAHQNNATPSHHLLGIRQEVEADGFKTNGEAHPVQTIAGPCYATARVRQKQSKGPIVCTVAGFAANQAPQPVKVGVEPKGSG